MIQAIAERAPSNSSRENPYSCAVVTVTGFPDAKLTFNVDELEAITEQLREPGMQTITCTYGDDEEYQVTVDGQQKWTLLQELLRELGRIYMNEV